MAEPGPTFADDQLDTILSSVHGRQRRMERDIAKEDLQAAVQFGVKEPTFGPRGDKRWKYTFADVVFITDETSTKEITSWVLPACGVDLEKVPVTVDMINKHHLAVRSLADKSTWTSHSVVVIDQSGSMRKTDATGGVTRSDLTWLTLAVVMVGKKLKSGERKSTDVFSLVDMRDTGKVLLHAKPYDWILYNKLVELLRTTAPLGAGNYLPALDAAKELLFSNRYGGCALMLTFLSDGRPSDRAQKGVGSCSLKVSSYCCKRIGTIASRLGSRLTVGAIALGKQDLGEFSVLNAMLQTAKEYGCNCFFQPPSLCAKDLANSLTWLSSSVTSTMIQMTDVNSKRQRQFKNYKKETLKEVGVDDCITGNWIAVQMSSKSAVGRDGEPVIHRSIVRTQWDPRAAENKRKTGNGWSTYRNNEIFHSESAIGVAFKKFWFGEGAERLVKEFREFDKSFRFVGPAMVAKGSKYIVDNNEQDDERTFHKVFIKTQKKAKQLAEAFNRKLANLKQLRGKLVPRIEFLECSVYMLDTPSGRRGYLVEKMLDIKKFKYQKWNDNAGRVNTENNDRPTLASAGVKGESSLCAIKELLELYPIPEDRSHTGSSCDELYAKDVPENDTGTEASPALRVNGISSDEDQTDDDFAHEGDANSNYSKLGRRLTISDHWDRQRVMQNQGSMRKSLVVDEIETNVSGFDGFFDYGDIPQAFSCFTHSTSKRKLLVCDLQGVLNTDRNPPVFELTDPVIHNRRSNPRETKYGRTDMGLSGIHAFFQTHKHNNLCRMLTHQYPRSDDWTNYNDTNR